MTSGSNKNTGGGTDTGGVVTEQVRQGTQQVAQSAQQAIGQVTDQATQQAQSMIAGQKKQATTMLRQVSGGLRQTGQSLEHQQPQAAGILDSAASRIDGVTQYLEQRDIGQLINETENLARQNAALFLGGAFALGVLAARFLKSSAPSQPSSSGQYAQRYGGDYRSEPSYGSYAGYQPFPGTESDYGIDSGVSDGTKY